MVQPSFTSSQVVARKALNSRWNVRGLQTRPVVARVAKRQIGLGLLVSRLTLALELVLTAKLSDVPGGVGRVVYHDIIGLL